MKKFVYILITVFIFSCNSNTIYKKPKDLIPRDSMILLIKDMYIASSSRHIKNKFSKKEKNYLPLVYEKYKIDSFRFKTSNNFYTSNVETYHEMVSDVKEILKKELAVYERKTKIQDSIQKVERRIDSIKNVERDIKIKDSILIHKKEQEIDKIKKSILKKPKDSITFKKEITEIQKLIDSVQNKAKERTFLKEKTALYEKLRDSLKRKPKNKEFLTQQYNALKKTIDSIKKINGDSIQLKNQLVGMAKLKDSSKNKINKALKLPKQATEVKEADNHNE